MMRKVLILAALAEAMTGLVLLLVPSLVGWLLFGEQLTGTGMLIYSAAVTLYLAYVGFTGNMTGILLWPAAALHLVLTATLARAAIKNTTKEVL
jgi:hypothetical protein